jgi:hypothetical protein
MTGLTVDGVEIEFALTAPDPLSVETLALN